MILLLVFFLLNKTLFSMDNLTISADYMIRDILLNNPFSKERKYAFKKQEESIQKLPIVSLNRNAELRIIGVVKIDDTLFIAVPEKDKILLLKEGDKYNGIVIKQVLKNKVIIENSLRGVKEEIIINKDS